MHGSRVDPFDAWQYEEAALSRSDFIDSFPWLAVVLLLVHLQSFFLTIKSQDTDGSLTTIESIPCEAGSGVEFCMVEVCVFAEDAGVGRVWW